jgi:hypothetical protein
MENLVAKLSKLPLCQEAKSSNHLSNPKEKLPIHLTTQNWQQIHQITLQRKFINQNPPP